MDADDILPEGEAEKIRRAMARGRNEAFYFLLENVGADRSRYPQLRLFPNLPGVAFERPIHEQIVPSLERLGIACVRTDIRVVHTGYTTPERASEKRRKYLGMMRRWLETHPEDADIRFRVGQSLLGEGELAGAEAEFRALVDDGELKARRPSIARMARIFLGRVLMVRARHPDALPPLREATEMDPGSGLSRLYLAECLMELGDLEAAREQLREARDREAGEVFFPMDRDAFRAECERLRERCAPSGSEKPSDTQPALRNPQSAIRNPQSKMAASAVGGERLSLAMIVRNEEPRLGRCLESVRGLVDEIVVVDTGSTDGTVEVARRHGASVHHFEWCEDFAAARNESIRHATGDWIMWLDADDIFPRENFERVRRAMAMG
jgi:tetratricopeptide (TPR) repeat protein